MRVPAPLVLALSSLRKDYGFGAVPLAVFLAQSALETRSFDSASYRIGLNAFGMRRARVRPTPAVGDYLGHARYLTVGDGVADYLDRQRAYAIPNTSDPGRYIAATAASGYATAPNYAAAWSGLLSKYSGARWPVFPVPVVLLLGLTFASYD